MRLWSCGRAVFAPVGVFVPVLSLLVPVTRLLRTAISAAARGRGREGKGREGKGREEGGGGDGKT